MALNELSAGLRFLSSFELSSLVDSEADSKLRHRWILNEDSGPFADSAGSADGTNNGTTQVTGNWNNDAARESDGTQYIETTQLESFGSDMANDFAVAFTIQTTDTDTAITAVNNDADATNFNILLGNPGYLAFTPNNPGSLIFFLRDGDNISVESDSEYNDDTPHRVVMNKAANSASGLEIWVDQTQVAVTEQEDQAFDSPTDFDVPFLLFAQNNTGTPANELDGIIDDYCIFNTSLTQSEIESYQNPFENGGGGGATANTIPSTPYPTFSASHFTASSPSDLTNPVLTSADVSDANVDNVADPGLFVDSAGTWHVFVEIWGTDFSASNATIAHATSSDGRSWTYDQIVINTDYHTALPHVFLDESDGTYYMTCHSEDYDGDGSEEALLFEATNWPTEWSLVGELFADAELNDPVVFPYDGKWWMFYGAKDAGGGTNSMKAAYADTLTGSYTEHPDNPLILDYGRPCGRPIVETDGGTLYHVGMDQPTAVHGYTITELTTTSFSFTDQGVLDSAGSPSWKSDKFHNWDPWLANYRADDGDKWVVAVDGDDGTGYSMGIYELQL